MESQRLPAEILPDLYRAILDGVAVLERSGSRAEAARIRVAATRAYSTAWDEARVRRLETLSERLRHTIVECQASAAVPRPSVRLRARRLRLLAPLFG